MNKHHLLRVSAFVSAGVIRAAAALIAAAAAAMQHTQSTERAPAAAMGEPEHSFGPVSPFEAGLGAPLGWGGPSSHLGPAGALAGAPATPAPAALPPLSLMASPYSVGLAGPFNSLPFPAMLPPGTGAGMALPAGAAGLLSSGPTGLAAAASNLLATNPFATATAAPAAAAGHNPFALAPGADSSSSSQFAAAAAAAAAMLTAQANAAAAAAAPAVPAPAAPTAPAAPPAAAAGRYLSKAAQKRQRQQEAHELRTMRMCVTDAKRCFKLTDKDIDTLTDVVYKRNPHGRYAPPMRLYLISELKALADRKPQMLEEQRERREAAREEAQARKAEARAAAEAAAAAFGAAPVGPREVSHGSVALPDTCLCRIMACLVEGLQPGGLMGPSAVAADLANAALVCWDFCHAAKPAFLALADATAGLQQQVPLPESKLSARLRALQALPGDASLGGWAFWDTALQAPTELKLPQLKAAAKALGLQVTGTKAELMLRVLGAFNLTGPTTAPAQLLRALALERSNDLGGSLLVWDGPNASRAASDLSTALLRLAAAQPDKAAAIREARAARGAAGMRAAITAAGYTSLTAFLEDTRRPVMGSAAAAGGGGGGGDAAHLVARLLEAFGQASGAKRRRR